MPLFRRHKTPEVLGGILYEALRKGIATEGDLSARRFLKSIELDRELLSEQLHGEIVVGLMFAGLLAVERSASPRVATRIFTGMKGEFQTHLHEQGASQIQCAEWEAVSAARFLEYRKTLEEYTGFEPPWKLGRQFYWNIVGESDFTAMNIKIATLYLLAGRDVCQNLLNIHGPTLLPEPQRAGRTI